jgi:uncharacterized protein YndB with AHSA1/START domain
MQGLPSGKDTLVLAGEFEAFTPQELFDHWVVPELVVQWWPQEATVEPRVGGAYRLEWPEKNWVLSGFYTAFDPGRKLGFTWSWNHDVGGGAPLQVDVAFEPAEKGSRMTITHGPWGLDEASQTEREGVKEGWIHFAMRLAMLRPGEAT